MEHEHSSNDFVKHQLSIDQQSDKVTFFFAFIQMTSEMIQNPLELPFVAPQIVLPTPQPFVAPAQLIDIPQSTAQLPILTPPPQPIVAEPRQPRMTEKQRMAIIVQFIKTGVQPLGYVVKEDENGGYRVTTVKSKDPIVEAQKKRERYIKKLLEVDPTLKDKFEQCQPSEPLVSPL